MDDDAAWRTANNIYTVITRDEGTGQWRDSVMDILKMVWWLGREEGRREDA